MDLSAFPYLQDNYAPVEEECDWGEGDLVIEGAVPRKLVGAFMRDGANTAFQPNHYVYPLDGDGMIHAVYFEDGHVHYRNRWVETNMVPYYPLGVFKTPEGDDRAPLPRGAGG